MTDRKRFVSLAIVLASVVVAALTLVDWSWAQRWQHHEQTQEQPHWSQAKRRQHHEQTQEQPQEQTINEQFHRSLSQLGGEFDIQLIENIARMIDEGRRTFRFDTFGDEAFWGDRLRLHQAIAGERLGGVGRGISPRAAINLGLKVDADRLPKSLISQLYRKATLDDPAVTLALLKLQAVVGVTGFFNSDGSLRSVGLQCALCHSTVDNSVTFGIGCRLDGWANRDQDIGALVALSPNLDPFAEMLGVDVPTVSKTLNSWGPGKFDAELFLDGKSSNPLQVSHGDVTGMDVPGATMIPNAYGLAGFNQHTWTGAWGSVSYWNAFAANFILRGIGTFFDPRLDNAGEFPIAARNRFGNVRNPPDEDRITSKLPALHFYQLAIPAPKPKAGRDFDVTAARRGNALFVGKARCNDCHVKPLWTEPGRNLHKPEEIGIDSFQAERGPDGVYKTQNLTALFVRELGLFMRPENKGRFYHDGRFKTLLDVVNHYNIQFNLGLTDEEKRDLVEYLKSL
jgi:hypothetical protein